MNDAQPRGVPDIPGVLLAGGLARRMGGGDKPMRTIGGRTILERVIARLAPQCDGLILNANGDPARFAAFGLPVVADGVADFPGPLAGKTAIDQNFTKYTAVAGTAELKEASISPDKNTFGGSAGASTMC